jgi:Ras-related protein Rab-28
MYDSDEDDPDIIQKQFKLILLGDGAVGKTSIAKRFSQDTFAQTYKQTVGVDFLTRKVDIPPNYSVTLQLWDIGGQSIGSRMIRNYISGADAVMLCYDITNYESFANLEDWYRLVCDAFEGKQMPCCALIANKTDLKHMAQVRLDKHSQFIEENSMMSFMISAKSGDQIQLAFFKMAAHLCGVPDAIPGTQVAPISTVIPAVIIDTQRHDTDVSEGKVPEYVRKRSACVVM